MIIDYPGYEIERFESEGGCVDKSEPTGANNGKTEPAVPKEGRIAGKEETKKTSGNRK
jgi:hypothetical protein